MYAFVNRLRFTAFHQFNRSPHAMEKLIHNADCKTSSLTKSNSLHLGSTLQVWKQGSTSWRQICTGKERNATPVSNKELRTYCKLSSSYKRFTLCWLYFSLIAGRLLPELVQNRRCNAFTQSERSDGLYNV